MAETGEFSLPGPFDRDRLPGLEPRGGTLEDAWGMVVPNRPADGARQVTNPGALAEIGASRGLI